VIAKYQTLWDCHLNRGGLLLKTVSSYAQIHWTVQQILASLSNLTRTKYPREKPTRQSFNDIVYVSNYANNRLGVIRAPQVTYDACDGVKVGISRPTTTRLIMTMIAMRQASTVDVWQRRHDKSSRQINRQTDGQTDRCQWPWSLYHSSYRSLRKERDCVGLLLAARRRQSTVCSGSSSSSI